MLLVCASLLLALAPYGRAQEAELFFEPLEDDPKEAFFRGMRALSFDGELPSPGGFQELSRERRALQYRVLESPGLHSHFRPLARARRSLSFDEDAPQPEGRKGRMLLDGARQPSDSSREPRKAAPQQTYEDSLPMASDSGRVPRVRFVTQRRPEEPSSQQPLPPPLPPPMPPLRPRAPRPRGFMYWSDPDWMYDAPRYDDRFEPRHESRYEPVRYHLNRYDARYDMPRYEPRYEPRYYRYQSDELEGRPPPMMPLPLPPEPSPATAAKSRRIIYYATLPEVVRTPDARYRYAVPSTERDKQVQVSTDLSVRETRKEPERRYYSHTGRRYQEEPKKQNAP